MPPKTDYFSTPAVRPIDLSRPRHIHLVGIGGAGMSAIATVLATLGHRVTGTDQNDSEAMHRLQAANIEAVVGHDAARLAGAEIVARSTAIPDRNPEIASAVADDMPIYRRDEILAAITGLTSSIAVGGTHGKTTTASMLTVVLRAAGLAPSFIIGGRVHDLGVGAKWDAGDHLVVEADESDGTFLRLKSAAGIVTSVEQDHLDYYRTAETFEQAFVEFLQAIPGPRVVSMDDPAAARIATTVDCLSYGTDPRAEFGITDYDVHDGRATFTLVRRQGDTHEGETHDVVGSVVLPQPGIHNARNATATIVMAMQLGVEAGTAIAALESFQGVARRWEERGVVNEITFIDDYAHLPSEVELTLHAAAASGFNRVVCVFQPHRYTRTQDSGSLFGDSFSAADLLLVAPIYTAGEAPIDGVTSRLVSDAVRAGSPPQAIEDVDDRGQLIERLVEILQPGDLCLTLGAGDLTTVPDEVQDRLRAAGEGA